MINYGCITFFFLFGAVSGIIFFYLYKYLKQNEENPNKICECNTVNEIIDIHKIKDVNKINNHENEFIDEKTIDWKSRGWFVAEVSHREGNLIHSCLVYYSGDNYRFNMLVNDSYEDNECQFFNKFDSFYYLKLIRRIDMTIPNQYKLLKDINV